MKITSDGYRIYERDLDLIDWNIIFDYSPLLNKQIAKIIGCGHSVMWKYYRRYKQNKLHKCPSCGAMVKRSDWEKNDVANE